jgi:membrane protein YqaA with SNARE-associated domain
MLLFKLALSQMTLSSNKDKSEIYLEFESIYAKDDEFEDFRHFYSDIFAVLSLIDKDPSLGNMDILSQNMDIVRQGYRPMNNDVDGNPVNIEKQINKFYDHINLEIARMNYFKETEMRTETELQKVSETLSQVENSVSSMENTIDMADEMQKQYITILGIFASIVLAFTGGIAFSTSVLENIANASIYRTVLIAVLLAFVLTNIIYILTRFIMEIVNKKKEKIKYPKYMIVLNVIYGILVVGILICWMFDVPRAIELFQDWVY